MIQNINELLSSYGLSENLAQIISYLILITGIALIAVISNYIAKKILLAIVYTFIKKSKTDWDDVLVKRKVFSRLSHLAPAIVIYLSAAYIPQIQTFVEQLAVAYMLFIGLGVWNGFLSAIVDIYNTYEVSKEKPIKGFIQVFKIISFVLVAIYVISILINRSPVVLFSGLGALSAVILLIFKDSILGLVAGIQLSANDMVRRGDWIEMSKFGADGDVIDVTLNTVKVQNWDKTIVTIPAYSLISDSFKNWRGMSESGGRRIKRTISIDMNSVKFCTEQMLQKFKKIKFLTKYLNNKEIELKSYNEKNQIDNSILVN
ncbi:MAG: mechanosensitive ion channel, partial [candidate division Zixibacteria bacterium]|nr:mechanosensitive ion channel [candidate division Zixibacteria bacterium]